LLYAKIEIKSRVNFPTYLLFHERFYREVHMMVEACCRVEKLGDLMSFENVNGVIAHIVQDGYEDKFVGGHINGEFEGAMLERVGRQAVQMCDNNEGAVTRFPYKAEEAAL